jgi:hypothetical protein
MNKWERMETAPKGEVIWGYFAASGWQRMIWWNPRSREWATEVTYVSDKPTHWMPMPLGPPE